MQTNKTFEVGYSDIVVQAVVCLRFLFSVFIFLPVGIPGFLHRLPLFSYYFALPSRSVVGSITAFKNYFGIRNWEVSGITMVYPTVKLHSILTM